MEEESFDIFLINIRSFFKHEEDILVDLHAKKSKYICLTETWLNPLEDSPFQRNNKYGYHASFGRGKGSCILAPEEKENFHSYSTENFQFVSLFGMNLQMTVLYISHGADLTLVVNALQDMMDTDIPQIVMGDFNFDSKESNSLQIFMEEKRMLQIVNEPTHQDGHCLDHIYVSNVLHDTIQLKVLYKFFHSVFSDTIGHIMIYALY